MISLLLSDEFAFYYQIAIKKAPKPPRMKDSQYVNYLAIQLLEEIGNDYPSQKEINLVETLVMRYLNGSNDITRNDRSHALEAAMPSAFSYTHYPSKA